MRRFLCLLLVLCLMASFFAIPASATAVTTATFDGLAAVAAMIAGSGVTINAIENFPVFNTLVSSVFDHLTALDIIDAAGTISALVSGQKTYIPTSVVQSVKDYLFSSGTLQTVSGASVGETFQFYAHTVGITSCESPVYYGYFITYQSDTTYNYYKCIYSASPFTFTLNGGASRTSNEAYGGYYTSLGSGTTTNLDTYTAFLPITTKTYDYSAVIPYLLAHGGGMIADVGITSGEIAPVSGLSIEENYPAWYADAITSPPITLPGGTEDDEAIPYIPVSIPSYSVSTPAIPPSQAEIWTGTNTSGSGSGSDSDGEAEEIPVVPDVAVGVAGLLTTVKLIADYIVEFKDAVIEWIDVKWTAFVSWLTETLTAIKERAIALADYMALIKDGLLEWIQVTWVNFVAWLTETLTAIKERAIELATYLATIATWLVDVLGVAVESILGVLFDILAWALGLVEALVAAFEALLIKIFVPDIASIQAAVADMRAQFPFFDSIIATGQYIVSGISSGEPPVIYIHLENAEGLYTWGNTVAVLDMSFYSRYKPAGDVIMSSALLTFFAWRTLKHLPSILSGVASDSDVFKET